MNWWRLLKLPGFAFLDDAPQITLIGTDCRGNQMLGSPFFEKADCNNP
jgi:hypothetical protein